MSIINEALKKAQENLEKNNPNEKQNTSQNKNTNIADKKQKQTTGSSVFNAPIQSTVRPDKIDIDQTVNNKINFAVGASLLILVLFISGFLILKKSSQSMAQNNTSPVSTLERNPIATQLTKSKSSRKSLWNKNTQDEELIVNGIMTEGTKKIALVNNEIYQIGDYIRGWKLVEIDLDRIQLLDNGKILTIKVRKPKEE